MNPEIADRLANLNIQLLSEAKGHSLFGRGNLVALVERNQGGFGSIGSTGVMTENGLAYLVWRGGRALLVGRSGEVAAAPSQVQEIRQFSDDLKSALSV